jgi:uncharacterized membrane protein
MRQWLLSFSYQQRFLFANRPEIMRRVLDIVHVSSLPIWTGKQTIHTTGVRRGVVTLIHCLCTQKVLWPLPGLSLWLGKTIFVSSLLLHRLGNSACKRFKYLVAMGVFQLTL